MEGREKATTLAKLYCKYRSQKGIDQNWQRIANSTVTSGFRKMDYPIFPSAVCPLLLSGAFVFSSKHKSRRAILCVSQCGCVVVVCVCLWIADS